MDTQIVLSKPLRRHRELTDAERKQLAELPSDWIPFVQRNVAVEVRRSIAWDGLERKFRRQLWLTWWLQKTLRLPSILLRPLVRA